MKTIKLLAILAVCSLLVGSVSAQIQIHGISFLKGAISPVEVGDPYEAVFLIANNVDTAGDTLRVVSLVDTVLAAGGNVVSPNLMPILTWTLNGGAYFESPSHLILPPGASAQSDPYSFYTVVTADFFLPNHALVDTAVIVWNDECDGTSSNCNTLPRESNTVSQATVTAPLPCVTVKKSVDCDVAMVGKELTYTFEVENCGPNPLTLVSVIDTVLGNITADAAACSPLAVGQTCSFNVNYTIQPGDPNPLPNTVTVTYVDEFQQQATDSDSASVDIIHPNFTVTKICTSNPIPEGGPATFLVTINNTGDVALSFTTDEAAESDIPEPFEIAAGGMQDLIITVPIIGDCIDVVNQIMVTANLVYTIDCPIEDIVKTSNPTTCYCAPEIEVKKEADCDVATVGKEITYTITITNTGGNTLTLDSVTDTLLGDITATAQANGCTTLAGGASCDFTVTRTIQAGDPDVLDNIVSVVYLDPQQVEATDDAMASVTVLHPDFTVTKTCTSDPIPAGGPATFNVAIQNTGDVDLTVTTNEAAYSSIPEPIYLPVGVTQNLTITIPTDGASDLLNTISVTAEPNDNEFECPVDPIVKTASDTCTALMMEGCTPGFWKNHTNCWACFSKSDKLNTVFTFPSSLSALGNDSLLKALGYGGGKGVTGAARILLRAAVSSLLNACDPDVNFPLTVEEVITQVNTALDTKNRTKILTLATTLDKYNNYGCPINSQCNRTIVNP